MTKEALKLAEKYRALYCWCKELQSSDYYIENQLLEAEQDNAPSSAIYKRDNQWVLAEDIKNEELRKRLLAA